MATFIKPDSVALNTAHDLYANIHRFYEFGVLDKELVTDTALTISGASIVDDDDIGVSRAFVAGATVAGGLSLPQDATVLIVTAGRGTRAGTAAASDCNFFYTSGSTLKIDLRYSYNGGGRFTATYDGATGATRSLNGDAFASDLAFNTGHAIAFHYPDTETMKSCLNGTVSATTNTTAGGALGSPPVSVPFFATNGTVAIGTTANFPVGAIVVFNKLLSDAELEEVTTTPWALLVEAPVITAVDTDDIISQGQQDIVINVRNIPAGQVPVRAGAGGTAGVGGTDFTGFSVAAGTTAGAYTITADVPVGIATSSNVQCYVEYAAS